MACLGARIVAASVDGERSIPAGDFFEGIYATTLKPHEMIVRIEVPLNGPGWTYHFDEIARRHGDFAVGGLALGVRHDSHTMAECRVAYVGMEAFSRRLPSVEQALANVAFNDAAAIESAVRLLDSEFEFVEGGEFPSSYRLRIAQHLLTRSLKHIAEVARTDGNR
jgi:carbon-monoxide dehydrogenase medium subunit